MLLRLVVFCSLASGLAHAILGGLGNLGAGLGVNVGAGLGVGGLGVNVGVGANLGGGGGGGGGGLLGLGLLGLAPPAPNASSCETLEDCRELEVCAGNICVDPCIGMPCVEGALCVVIQHKASCVSCPQGQMFHKDEGLCVPLPPQCEKDEDCLAGEACAEHRCTLKECVGKKCGNNAFCGVIDGVAKCECDLGYVGDPETECLAPPPLMSAPVPVDIVAEIQAADLKEKHNCSGHNFPTPDGKKTFIVFPHIKLDWHNAFMYCMAHGLRLAAVESEDQHNLLLLEIKKTGVRNGKFYISGTDIGYEERWYWLTTGLPISKYTYWMPQRPVFNYYYSCMTYAENDALYGTKGYLWFDELCGNKHNFVCESYV